MGNWNPAPILNSAGQPATSFFEFNVPSASGGEVSLSNYKGKNVYLIVNVASNCGLTERNYEELKIIHDRYKDRGFEVLAFPCNNFASQEPGTNEEIQKFAKSKGAQFPVLGKIECENVDKTHPVYQYLKGGQPLKWNFSKILCDENGRPVKKFEPEVGPMALQADIISLLNK